ncbi:MAG: hypothetical protein ACR2LM_19375 [Pyrinomonadaceae bacterium]
MRNRYYYLLEMIAALVLTIVVTSLAIAQTEPTTPAQATPTPSVSEGESKAATAINDAPDAAAKLTLAEAFVKKYPKSSLRPKVVSHLTNQISRVTDDAQRLALAERFQKSFPGDAESQRIGALVVDAYVRTKRVDEAFNLGANILTKQPDNIEVLTTLAIAGTDEVRRQNPKYSDTTSQYALKAIEMIEGNKKPASLDDAAWTHQATLLPRLYLDRGALALAGGKIAEARPHLEKAISLDPAEPSAYFFLGGIVDEEYAKVAESFQAMPAGKEKQDALRKATELMDKVIDLYARALGAAADKAEYKPLYDKALESITPYYKYRHNRSTDGLQQLIDKYKAPAKPS